MPLCALLRFGLAILPLCLSGQPFLWRILTADISETHFPSSPLLPLPLSSPITLSSPHGCFWHPKAFLEHQLSQTAGPGAGYSLEKPMVSERQIWEELRPRETSGAGRMSRSLLTDAKPVVEPKQGLRES